MSELESSTIEQFIYGTEEVTIDTKGRVLLTKKKREKLGQSFVLVLEQHGCLNAYSNDHWRQVVSEIFNHEKINAGTQAYARLILGNAEDEIRFDAQGRFLVPQRMREAAELKDKVVLIGCGNRMEIWAKHRHDEYSKNPEGYALEASDRVERAYQRMKAAT